MDSETWIALVIACVATAYVLYRARRKTKKDPLENRTMSSSMAQHRAVERQMSNLLVELSEMARTVSAGLDTRSAKLEALLDAADQRIETLRALNHSESAGASSLPASSLLTSPDAARFEPIHDASTTVVPPPRVEQRHVEIYAMSDQGRSAHDIAAALGQPTGEIELILALRPRETTTT
ncbi:hypothetical protein BH09PLA1_BH09PLA1_04550 [soil metagenome]